MEQVLTSLALSGASLVGKAAISYAQSIAVRKLSGFIQQRLEGASATASKGTAATRHRRGSTAKDSTDGSDNESADDDDDSSSSSANVVLTEQALADQARRRRESAALDMRLRSLRQLQTQLEHKLGILTPALDLCEWAACRSHSKLLASALTLSRDLNRDLEDLGRSVGALGQQSGTAASPATPLRSNPDAFGHPSSVSMDASDQIAELDQVVLAFRAVIGQVDSLVPYLQMALQVSGVQFGNRVPVGVSPVLLSRASHALSVVDAQLVSFYASQSQSPPSSVAPPAPTLPMFVGPVFWVKMYSLFEGSARSKTVVDWTWKEEYPKCRARLLRHDSRRPPDTPSDAASSDEPLYQRTFTLALDQDLNDGRFHDELFGNIDSSAAAGKTADVYDAKRQPSTKFLLGEQRRISLDSIQSVFYTNSGKLLNIEDATMPVLVLKLSVPVSEPDALARTAKATTQSAPSTPVTKPKGQAGSATRVQWIALEVYDADAASDDDDADGQNSDQNYKSGSESESGGEDDEPSAQSSTSTVDALSSRVQDLRLRDPYLPKTGIAAAAVQTPSRPGLLGSPAADMSGARSRRRGPRHAAHHRTPGAGPGSVMTPSSARRRGGGIAVIPTGRLSPWIQAIPMSSHGPTPAGAGPADLAAIEAQKQAERERLEAMQQQYLSDLCLLEYMLRMASLEQTENMSHLDVMDEKMYAYLVNDAGQGSGSSVGLMDANSAAGAVAATSMGSMGGQGSHAERGDVPLHATVPRSKAEFAAAASGAGSGRMAGPGSPLDGRGRQGLGGSAGTGGAASGQRFLEKLRSAAAE
ncbi:RanGTP-binding protein-domain-containing protein [Entophlyctis helioformis]|nr:RanGTP-binding protein-domain-containing protein [Entophlyctis helioformis]